MKNAQTKFVLVLSAASLWFSAATAAVWDVDFQGGLMGGFNESTPNVSRATGGEFGPGMRYDDGVNLLTLNLAYGLFGFNPLEADYTAAHIHRAPAGFPGPVVISLTPWHVPAGPRAGTFVGTVPLTDALETELFAGQLYVNIHSTAYPGGEIRGQLVAVPEPGVWALLSAGLAAIWLRRRG